MKELENYSSRDKVGAFEIRTAAKEEKERSCLINCSRFGVNVNELSANAVEIESELC